MAQPTIPQVHLAENHPASCRALATGRAFPVGEADRLSRADGVEAIVAYLDVERSARYQRSPRSTFCNIYACDFCYLAGAYLPRVWWTKAALDRIAAGEDVPVRYGETVAELNANSLYSWLRTFGPQFGWSEAGSEEDLQQAVNGGSIGLICAQRRMLSAPGHISMVVPEREPDRVAERRASTVWLPLQSQAGAHNFRYSCGLSKWWSGAQFRAFGFFVHP